jgi:hypothetical protein
MAKLSDIQTILLSTAGQRGDGNLLPPPESIGRAGSRVQKSLSALLKRGFAAEAVVTAPDRAWREDGDLRIGLVLTASGREAIGLEAISIDGGDEEVISGVLVHEKPAPRSNTESPRIPERPAQVVGAVRAGSKQALIVELLRRENGATVAELTEATGWLPHTTRAALTGLRKKGHKVEKAKRREVTFYTVTEAR